MSKYTPSMVAELNAQDTWTYEDAKAYAADRPDISTRSVISKIKSEGLAYVPKTVEKSTVVIVRKADIVANIAAALNLNYEALQGLSKSDKTALNELLRAVA